jgi:hypothetical protein
MFVQLYVNVMIDMKGRGLLILIELIFMVVGN